MTTTDLAVSEEPPDRILETPDELTKVPCPECGNLTLRLEWRMKAKRIGEFSLSGQQTKFSATERPFLVCTTETCDFEEEGHR